MLILYVQVAFQYTIITSYSPLKNHLPLTLAHLSYGMPKEEGLEGSILEGSENEFDPRAAARQSAGDETNHTADRRGALPDEQPKDDVEMANLAVRKLKEAGFHVEPASQITQGAPAEVSHPADGVNATDFAGKPDEDQGQHAENSSREQLHGRSETDQSNTLDTAQEMRRGEIKRHDDFEADAFSHPATKEDQRIIWLPVDELGLGQAEVDDNNAVGIVSSTKDAVLTNKGSVNITGPPPDIDREM